MKFIFAFLLSGVAYAAGDGHGGGPETLISSAVNLSLLLGFLIWKLKGPMKTMFVSKSTDTKEMIERAASKAKEAQMMIETQKKKSESVDAEISKLEKESTEQLAKFEQDYKVDVEKRVNKLKEDAGQKIEAEKKELLDNLNSQLLSAIALKTSAFSSTVKTSRKRTFSKSFEALMTSVKSVNSLATSKPCSFPNS